jgi:aryl-alcohol dehydrogenase-like predicted oxidoreductase
MLYRPLGNTGVQVSVICLGTMTWGEQNTQDEAFAQMDYALDRGVTFWDTAEMYPVPPRAETYATTERYIGAWLAARGGRERIVLASKIAGPGRDMNYMRNGPRLNAQQIEAGVDASLKRLQTDYLDLYQLHWPERSANIFGRLNYVHNPDEAPVPLDETLRGLENVVKAGKVRFVGVSNETAWGVSKFLHLADSLGLPRIQSVQNPYSLLNRTYEINMAEISIREQCGLLAYSPLAMGILSGKYDGGRFFPEASRLKLFTRFQRYQRPRAWAASEKYIALAHKYGLPPAQMALSFVNRQPFVTANIIGATTMAQLAENIASIDISLPDELIADLEAVHVEFPNPAP